jgi:hypothetical protein
MMAQATVRARNVRTALVLGAAMLGLFLFAATYISLYQ